MRLYTTSAGIAREDEPGVLSVVDVAGIAGSHGPCPDLGAALRAGLLGRVCSAPVVKQIERSDDVLLAPILRPGKVPIIGLNYQSHADEVLEWMANLGRSIERPTEPNFHLTPGSAVIGPGEAIILPAVAPQRVDYEGEIAVVIGRTARCVGAAEAWSHIAGLTIANDVSARDIQLRAMTGDLTVSVGHAKSLDTFKPLGPCLVTIDEFEEPLNLGIQTHVNGELRQDARTTDFIYQVSELVSYVSKHMTLEPGDVLSTGSPRGVGFYRDTFLSPGDRVDITVEQIGTLSNHVVAAD